MLAPTYVSSGVGGKPTIEFSTVNVQVVSGSGSTAGAINGEGNLIVGYAENAAKRAQSGSNDLIVGANNSWSGYGQIVGGSYNQASGDYTAAFGLDNVAKGGESLTGGEHNTANGSTSAVTGGTGNSITSTESGDRSRAARSTPWMTCSDCRRWMLEHDRRRNRRQLLRQRHATGRKQHWSQPDPRWRWGLRGCVRWIGRLRRRRRRWSVRQRDGHLQLGARRRSQLGGL